MSAFYVSHGSSPSRIRQEGFQIPSNNPNSPSLNAPPSPTTPFDSQNIFFAGSHNVFPNAFKKFNDRNAIDFSDTLASIMGSDSADDFHRGPPTPSSRQPQQQQDYSSSSASAHSPSHSQPANSHFFDISSFPSHLNNFRPTSDAGLTGGGLPDSSTSTSIGLPQSQPTGSGLGGGSLGHNFLGDPPLTYHHAHSHHHHTPTIGQAQQQQPHVPKQRHRASFSATSNVGPPPVLPRLNTMRTSSPSTVHSAGSPSDMNVVVPSSPFTPSGPSAGGINGVVNGVQPSSGAVRSTSRSRSRSRPATERNASVGGRSSRVTKKRTTSISSPSPPAGVPGNGVAVSNGSGQQQPMSIIIPDPRSAQFSHAMNGANAASPSTTAASWVFSPSSTQTAFSLPTGDTTAATSFSNTFAPQSTGGAHSLPMGGIVMDDDKTPPTKEDPSSKQAALLNEKRRRRRESHNAVERRRRDNINEKISELATLIPDCLLIDANGNATGTNGTPGAGGANTNAGAGSPPGAAAGGNGDESKALLDGDNLALVGGGMSLGAGSGDDQDPTTAAGQAAMKANKGVILRKSVDYIRYLQQLVQAQSEKNRDLEIQLAQYRSGQPPNPGADPTLGVNSASGNGNGLMYLSQQSGNNPEDGPFGPDFSAFDFARFANGSAGGSSAGPPSVGGAEMNNHHLVSVKEEDPSGIIDMNILPDEHSLQHQHQQHQNVFLPPNGYDYDHHLHQHQQQHQSFDLGGQGGSVLPQSPYNPHAHHSYMSSPPSMHQQRPQQPAVAGLQQQQQHMEASPSAAGSGSGVSDLEDVEEEDESVVDPDADTSNSVIDDLANGTTTTRGRKELRDQPGRFASSTNNSVSLSRAGRSVSKSRHNRVATTKQQLGTVGTPEDSGDAMHVDERS